MAFRSTFSPSFDCIVRAGDQGIALGNNSLSCWVVFDDLSADYEVIEINDSGGANFASAIQLVGGQIAFHQTNAAGTRISVVGPAPTAGVWAHYALTYDGTTLTGYVNGASVGTQTGLSGARGNWSGLQVGPAKGELQDACFYTVAITPEEVLQLYRNRKPGRRDGLRHELPCYPGATNRLIDYSGNALNFSNSGTPADANTWPQATWGASEIQGYFEADGGTTPAVGDGRTVFNGAGTPTVAVAAVGSGGMNFNAAATPTVAAAAGGDGRTRFNGSGAPAVAAAAAGTGLTLLNGGATAAVAAAAVGDGRTGFGGSATASVAVAAVGDGRTLYNGAATISGQASGEGRTGFGGSGTATVAIAAAGTGLTRFNGIGTGGGGGSSVPGVAVLGNYAGQRRHNIMFGTRRRVR